MKKPLNLVPFSDPRTATASGSFEYVLPAAPLISDYFKIQQTHYSNALTEIGTKLDYGTLDLKGTAIISYKKYILSIENYDSLKGGVGTTALQLLDSLIITATNNGNNETNTLIQLPLVKYKQMRGLVNTKETRKQVKKDLTALEAITLEYRGTGSQKDNYMRLKIGAGKHGIMKSVIFFDFRPEFLITALEQSQYMYWHNDALKFNDKYNPHSYYFSRKIHVHKRQNLGKANENTIGVRSLVNSSPDLRKKLLDTKTRFVQQILEPFERDLDVCSAFKWEYRGVNNAQAEAPDSLQEFLALNIGISWLNYPTTPELAKLKNDKKKQARKTKGKKPPSHPKK